MRKRRRRIGGLVMRRQRRLMREHERRALAGAHREVTDGAMVLAFQRDRRVNHELVGAGDRRQRLVVGARDPRHGASVIEAHYQERGELNLAPLADDDAHEISQRLAHRHEVDQRGGAFRCFETRLEHHRAFAIFARDLGVSVGGTYAPAAVLFGSQKSCETRG
jgi:hypothetical protein